MPHLSPAQIAILEDGLRQVELHTILLAAPTVIDAAEKGKLLIDAGTAIRLMRPIQQIICDMARAYEREIVRRAVVKVVIGPGVESQAVRRIEMAEWTKRVAPTGGLVPLASLRDLIALQGLVGRTGTPEELDAMIFAINDDLAIQRVGR